MHHRPLAFGKGPACGLQAVVRESRVGARADRSRRKPAVEAIQYGREVDLAARQPELGYVGQPQPVRRVGAELSADQVFRRLGYLSLVRAVFGALLRIGDRQALLAHQRPDDLLGHYFRVVARSRLVRDVPVSARVVGRLECSAHADAKLGIFVGPLQRPALVLIGALRYPQGSANSFGLLPVVALNSLMTRVFSRFVRELGLSAFKTFATPSRMSFSSSSWRIRSSRLPSNPS